MMFLKKIPENTDVILFILVVMICIFMPFISIADNNLVIPAPPATEAPASATAPVSVTVPVSVTAPASLTAPASVTTGAAVKPEKGPEFLKAEAKGVLVFLTWDKAGKTDTTYNIYRSTSPEKGFLKINKEEVKESAYTDGRGTSRSEERR